MVERERSAQVEADWVPGSRISSRSASWAEARAEHGMVHDSLRRPPH